LLGERGGWKNKGDDEGQYWLQDHLGLLLWFVTAKRAYAGDAEWKYR